MRRCSVAKDGKGAISAAALGVVKRRLDSTVMGLNGKMYAVYSVWNRTQDLTIREMSSPWETTGEEVVISPGSGKAMR